MSTLGRPRHSKRIGELELGRVLDDATKKRRIQKQLEALEQDNVQDDPHANLSWHKTAPKFEDELVGIPKQAKRKSAVLDNKQYALATKKGRKLRAELSKTRFRKNFQQMNEEFEKSRNSSDEIRLYSEVGVGSSRLPARKFCSVCGYFSKYSCVKCGTYFCSVECNDVHTETRCLKWIR